MAFCPTSRGERAPLVPGEFIGEDKNGSGQIRGECLLPIVFDAGYRSSRPAGRHCCWQIRPSSVLFQRAPYAPESERCTPRLWSRGRAEAFRARLGESLQGFGKRLQGLKNRVLLTDKEMPLERARDDENTHSEVCRPRIVPSVPDLSSIQIRMDAPKMDCSGLSFSWRLPASCLLQAMAGTRVQLQTVKLLQRL